MRNFLAVFRYTFLENIRKKMFIISTVIVTLMSIVLMLLPGLITAVTNTEQGKGDNSVTKSDYIVYVVDNAGIYQNGLQPLAASFQGISFVAKPASEIESLKEAVKLDKNKFLLVINDKGGALTCEYSVNAIYAGPSPNALALAIHTAHANSLLKTYSVPQDMVQKVLAPVSVNVNQQGQGMLQGMISSLLVTMILFFAVYLYGYGVSMSVAAEKTSRVMEILITSTKPSSIIIGKTAAMGVLGLLQLLLTFLVGGVTYAFAFPKNFSIMGESINLSGFTPFTILMLIVYFILGYALYAMLSAVAGATVSKAEDVNSAIMPVSMLSLISFFLAYYPSIFPGGEKITEIVSMIPFTASFAMPGRLLVSSVPLWQTAVSIALLIGSIVFFTWVSIKLYSSAVLHYGKRLKLGDLISMAKKK